MRIVLGLLVVVAACTHPHSDHRASDRVALTTTEAAETLHAACPAGSTAMGWRRQAIGGFGSGNAWCQDASGLLQGPTVATDEDCAGTHSNSGHYVDGWADGDFGGPRDHATFRHGQLDGVCSSSGDSITFRNGEADGPFTWVLSRVSTGVEIEAAPDSHGCHHNSEPQSTATSSLSGTFSHGILVGDLTLWTKDGGRRTIAVVADAPLVIDEVGGAAFGNRGSELLSPPHRWNHEPQCPYQNQSTPRRGPR